jgi:hypothetical protein
MMTHPALLLLLLLSRRRQLSHHLLSLLLLSLVHQQQQQQRPFQGLRWHTTCAPAQLLLLLLLLPRSALDRLWHSPAGACLHACSAGALCNAPAASEQQLRLLS